MESQIVKPYGLRVLRILSILNILVVVGTLFAFKFPSSKLSALSSLISIYAILSFILSIIVSILTIVAINRPNARLYKILIWLFVLDIIISIGSAFTTDIKSAVDSVLFILPGLFFLWYWIKLRNYFVSSNFNTEDPAVKKIDKKVNPFIIFWIIIIVVGSIISAGISTVGNVQDAIKYAKIFEGKSLQENIGYCTSQTSNEKDNCLLIAFSFEKDKANITPESCNILSDENNKVVCYAMIDKCDLVTDEKIRTVCEYTAKDLKEKQDRKIQTESSVR